MTAREQLSVVRRACEAGHFGHDVGWSANPPEDDVRELLLSLDAFLDEPAKADACLFAVAWVIYGVDEPSKVDPHSIGCTLLARLGRIPPNGVREDGSTRDWSKP